MENDQRTTQPAKPSTAPAPGEEYAEAMAALKAEIMLAVQEARTGAVAPYKVGQLGW